jgi:hypothetical protein
MRPRSRIVLPGGSGFLGQHLSRQLARQGHEVVILTRKPRPDSGPIRYLPWDGRTMGDWAASLDGAAAVVNLAGRTVNCRYTAKNKADIYASRLDSTRVLGQAVGAAARPPAVWINSSSATIYRHAIDRPMDELSGELGDDFSVDVCKRWEQTLADAPSPPATRKVALRSAMVFGPGEGGVYEAFARVVRLGLGGTLGPGTQYVSWVHVDDFCRAVDWLITHDDLAGPVNLAVPDPVPNREFMRAFRRALGRRVGLPATRWMLEAGAFVLRTETELLLKSRRVIPTRLLGSGFTFTQPDLEPALRSIGNGTF